MSCPHRDVFRKSPVGSLKDTMPDAQDAITEHRLKCVLEAVFPGIGIQLSRPIGGVKFSFKVWEFDLAVSLTLDKMSHQDTEGVALLLFTEIPPAGTGQFIRKRLQTASMEELSDEIDWCRSYMLGVAEAILRACRTMLSSPLAASIFDDE